MATSDDEDPVKQFLMAASEEDPHVFSPPEDEAEADDDQEQELVNLRLRWPAASDAQLVEYLKLMSEGHSAATCRIAAGLTNIEHEPRLAASCRR